MHDFINPRIIIVDTKITGLEFQGLTNIEKRIKHQLLRNDA